MNYTMLNKSRLLILILPFILAGCSFTHNNSTQPPRPVGNNTSSPITPPATSPSVPTQVPQENIERFYVVHGRRYAIMKSSQGFTETGTASWYGDPFHGRKTSNGEVYDMYQMTAAHKHLPLPTFIEVTNLRNNKTLVLRVNDRGPFVGNRVLDLSYAAAKELDVLQSGTAPVSIRALDDLNILEDQSRQLQANKVNYIQVASFTEHSNAFAYQKRLIANGIKDSRIVQVRDSRGQNLLRVQIGPINNGQAYDQAIEKLNKIGISNTLLVSE